MIDSDRISISVVPAKALGHAHTLLCDEAGSHLGVGIPRPSRRALASAPQDEEGLRMPWMMYLILRSGHRPRLEGRTTPMQRLPDVCTPSGRLKSCGQRASAAARLAPTSFRAH